MGYDQQAGSMHPTGMHSCSSLHTEGSCSQGKWFHWIGFSDLTSLSIMLKYSWRSKSKTSSSRVCIYVLPKYTAKA